MYIQLTCLKRPLKKEDKNVVFKTEYRLIQFKMLHSAILSTLIKLPLIVSLRPLFCLFSIFEWPLKAAVFI